MTDNQSNLMEKITSLCKRRGFIFPSSEAYGGLANVYDYGPMGAELLRNIKNLWWDNFVTFRSDIVGLDTSILMNSKIWEASGHTESFTDDMVDCKECKLRTRADHIIENFFEKKGSKKKVEGFSSEELSKIIQENKIPCPFCGKSNWTEARTFNLLFETNIGILPERQSKTYLRGEIAQGMFVNFKNVVNTARVDFPFGIAQSGKAFRNEITKGNFTFRMLEFNLAEIEYFFNPEKTDWEKFFSLWKKEMERWAFEYLELKKEKIFWREHTPDERSHYSRHTEDMDFEYPFGIKEMCALAYRTDFDLKNHTEKSEEDFRITDAETGKKFIPHVMEPTFGIDRTFLAVICNSYFEDEKNDRLVLKLPYKLAPYKVAVFPLVANKPELMEKAREVYKNISFSFPAMWDARGNIGKRYYAQDEIGTPKCVTIDYQTLEDDTVTVRDRDTMEQERIKISDLKKKLE